MENKIRYRVNFSESAKEIKADTTLELEGENITIDNAISQATELFDKAKKIASDRTMEKMRGINK